MRHKVYLHGLAIRSLIGGGVVLVLTLLLSSFITLTGAGSLFDTRPNEGQKVPFSSARYESPNAVSTGAYDATEGIVHGAVRFGQGLYAMSYMLHTRTIKIGEAITSTSMMVGPMLQDFSGAWVTGLARMTMGAAEGLQQARRAPVEVASQALISPQTNVVSALLRPAELRTAAVPTIDSKTAAATLEQLSGQRRAMITEMLANQLAENQRLQTRGVQAGDSERGGYPANLDNAAQDSLVDAWGMYNRECVSYTAWKVHQTFNSMPYWGGIGNANEWPRNARAAGILTGAVPRVRSVAVSMAGYYGHTMWVEAVNGNMIYVSQYNYDLNGRYSEMWVDGSRFTYIYFQ